MFLELTSLGHLPRGFASASLLPKAAVFENSCLFMLKNLNRRSEKGGGFIHIHHIVPTFFPFTYEIIII